MTLHPYQTDYHWDWEKREEELESSYNGQDDYQVYVKCKEKTFSTQVAKKDQADGEEELDLRRRQAQIPSAASKVPQEEPGPDDSLQGQEVYSKQVKTNSKETA